MFDLPSVRLGRIFGIPLEVNATWLIIFVLVVVSLAFGYFPSEQGAVVNVAVAALTALLLFASIVAHELSHSLVARAGGIEIGKVTLFMFGGVAEMEEEPQSPGREFVMAVAGPAMSLALSAAFFVVLTALRVRDMPEIVTAPLLYLSFVNLYVAIFNLLPGFPLDGGRVLRALIWGLTGDILKATRWASRAGQFIGYSLVAAAVIGVLQGALNLIWLGLVGWFIATLADNAYRQEVAKAALRGVTVAQLMTPDPVTAPGDITLEQLVQEHFLGGRHSRYPVLYDGAIVGLISLTRVKSVPREEWPLVRVLDVADTDLRRLVVDIATPAHDVLRRLAPESPGALVVVEDGLMAGIVTRADAIARLRVSNL